MEINLICQIITFNHCVRVCYSLNINLICQIITFNHCVRVSYILKLLK